MINNSDEIKRKFLVNQIPDLSGIVKTEHERYYLYRQNGIDLRIQRLNIKYELERKVEVSNLARVGEKIVITKEEFEILKRFCDGKIIRDSYQISKNTVLRIYQGRFEGLIRVEVEFQGEDEAQSFNIPDWFGKEITETMLAKDSDLLKLSTKYDIA